MQMKKKRITKKLDVEAQAVQAMEEDHLEREIQIISDTGMEQKNLNQIIDAERHEARLFEEEQREWQEERDVENRGAKEILAEKNDRKAEAAARTRARRLAEQDSVRLERNRRSRQARAEHVPATHQLALSPIESADAVPPHNCGPMDQTCTHCNADHFSAERPSRGQFNICCQKGRVTLVS